MTFEEIEPNVLSRALRDHQRTETHIPWTTLPHVRATLIASITANQSTCIIDDVEFTLTILQDGDKIRYTPTSGKLTPCGTVSYKRLVAEQAGNA